jgi:signal transduction histidine kinase
MGMPLAVRGSVRVLLVVGLRSDVARQLAALATTLETVGPLVLVLCAAGGYWLADRALSPVQLIARTAREISATDLSRRLNLRRRDELGQLASTFDLMLDRLEAAFERERQFTADASHELRTPLAIVDLEASRTLARSRTPEEYRQSIRIMQQENAHMSRLVDDLLALARADSGQDVARREEVDLGEVVLDAVERLAPLAQESGMLVRMEPFPALVAHGDRVALTRMVTNIVENALTHGAGRGTEVRVGGGCRRRDGSDGVWLRVADDGPGIAAVHLPHLCERFYRAEPARTHNADPHLGERTAERRSAGSGLGLAITQWIVEAHGGDLRIESEPGRGTVVEVWVPIDGGQNVFR